MMRLIEPQQVEVGAADHPSTSEEPVGSGEYEVQQGDCVESIASRSGHFWQTIWNHPRNAAIKSTRKTHNVLMPGDRLHIPPRCLGEVSCATDKLHKFIRRGVSCMLRVRVQVGGQPRSNEHFFLTVSGKVFEGDTGPDGEVEVAIPPQATSARLVVGVGLHQQVYELQLGGMDPIDTRAGLYKRLHNLGYCGPAEGSRYDGMEAAIAMFQKDHDLEATGICDAAMQNKLRQRHGS